MLRHVRLFLLSALCMAPFHGDARAMQVVAANPRDSASALLQRPARLRVMDVPLLDALIELEQRSGLALAYSPSLLPGRKRVSCTCADSSVAGALRTVLANTDFTFREDQGQIVLVPLRGEAMPLRPPEPRVAGAPVVEIERATLEPATITGRVTSDGDAPLAGALVALRRAQQSTVTSANGQFRIVIAEAQLRPGPDTLEVSLIGYRQQLVPVTIEPGVVQVDVAMAVDAVQLGALVVTGTAGNQQRAAQPAVIGSVDAEEVVGRAPVSNVTQVLKNRVPGITITEGSGTSGTASRINIRGAASLSLSNQPLVFIDGVRMESNQRDLVFVGGQSLSALDDLNPNDIDRIEVVKGPAAATLYGADASAGVIQIFTKRGRTGADAIIQNLTVEYGRIEPNFTPYSNYARCPESLTAPGSGHPLCEGLSAGAIVSDNPLQRQDAFGNGNAATVQYDVRGGGERYGYYASFGYSDEDGTTRNNSLERRSGRVNFNWAATPRLSFNATMGLSRNQVSLPPGDQDNNGYMINAGLGSPLTLRTEADGSIAGGWLAGNQSVEAISSIRSEISTLRITPSAQVQYNPFDWFTNRLTLGADLNQSNSLQMYPLNDRGWYSGEQAEGWVDRVRDERELYTVDYLGNIRTSFGSQDQFTSDLSFGTQYIDRLVRVLGATGIGLTTNSSNLIPGAATNRATEGYSRQKSFGFLVQEQVGYRDRLFLQLGMRVDRNSAFGSEAGSFFLPKAGVSYVMSEESYWDGVRPLISTMRLRAAYGTTGRSPTPGASLETYVSAPYITDDGQLRPGLVPLNPGNQNLEPERGTEFETGFDAGLFDDRVGLELTFFHKRTTDLLIQVPQPPSSGFIGGAARPFENIGEVLNRGFEFAVQATPVSRSGFILETRLQGTTLHNELISLGELEPFTNSYRSFAPGHQLGAWFVNRIREVDLENNRVIVSDTAEFLGNQMPSFEGSFSTTLTLLSNIRLHAQLDAKTGYRLYNLGHEYRDRYFRNSAEAVLSPEDGGYSDEERLRRYGPYIGENSGAQIPFTEVKEDYIQEGDHLRFSELSATFTLPERLVSRFGVNTAALTLGARNLALWSKFDGFDPEVLGTGPGTPGNSFYNQFYIAEVFTTPPMRRWIARLSVQF